jgi:hypothetical protein
MSAYLWSYQEEMWRLGGGMLLSFNRYENYQVVAGSENLRTRTCHFVTRGTPQGRERRYQKMDDMLLLFRSSVCQCPLPA